MIEKELEICSLLRLTKEQALDKRRKSTVFSIVFDSLVCGISPYEIIIQMVFNHDDLVDEYRRLVETCARKPIVFSFNKDLLTKEQYAIILDLTKRSDEQTT